MQKLFQRYREQQQSLESHASTRIKDVLKEIQKEEEFGDEEEEDVLEAILLDHVAFRTFKGLHHHDGDEKHHQFVNVKQMLMEKLRYRESGETLVFPKKNKFVHICHLGKGTRVRLYITYPTLLHGFSPNQIGNRTTIWQLF